MKTVGNDDEKAQGVYRNFDCFSNGFAFVFSCFCLFLRFFICCYLFSTDFQGLQRFSNVFYLLFKGFQLLFKGFFNCFLLFFNCFRKVFKMFLSVFNCF